MFKNVIKLLSLSFIITATLFTGCSNNKQNIPTVEEATALAEEAYLYGFPLVGMYELLHSQIINPETKVSGFNEFSHTSTLASAKTSFIPAPNNDTIYSRAWLDLREEPVIIEVPDTNERYYTIQVLDLFTETIANIGKRLNGTKPGRFAIVGPDWKGTLPEDVQVVKCNTNVAIAFLRVLVNGEEDLNAAVSIQESFKIASLSRYEQGLSGADEKTAEGWPEYKNENIVEFFETLNHVINLTPVIEGEEKVLAKFNPIGVGINIDKDIIKQIPVEALENGTEAAKAAIKVGENSFGDESNYWRVARSGIGTYNSDYLQRSVVWIKGALANTPDESLYPSTFKDSTGQILNGNNDYVLTFSKDEIPPVNQFWSLTMYKFSDALLYDNPINRYSLGDRSNLKFEEDGSLKIYLQNEKPSEDKVGNWLPAPPEDFYLSLRLYGPDESAINGEWAPPAVEKVN